MRVGVHLQAETDLAEVVLARSARGGAPAELHCWEQKPDQNGDDAHHHEQFDECEGGAAHRILLARSASSAARDGGSVWWDSSARSLSRGVRYCGDTLMC